jgi:hypothetical protein
MNVSLKKQASKEAAEDSTGTFISILQKKTKDVWINLMDGFGRTTNFFNGMVPCGPKKLQRRSIVTWSWQQ